MKLSSKILLGAIVVVLAVFYFYKSDRQSVAEMISAPSAQFVKGELGAIEDNSTPDARRRVINITVPSGLNASDQEREIRFAIKYVYDQFPDVDAIMARLFVPDNNTSIGQGVFAPFGDWNKAGESVGRDKYEVKITL